MSAPLARSSTPGGAGVPHRGAGKSAEQQWVVNEAPTGRWPALGLHQFARHRELIYFFALRDVRVRYKQAFLGVAWAGIQPLVGALMFTILFNRLADIDVSGPSYFSFALLGFGVWGYFSSTLQAGSSSLVQNSELLTKVSFPRIVAPAAALLPRFLDLSVALVLATAAAIVAGGSFSAPGLVIGLPLGIALLVLAVAGPVFFLSATIVKYRDASAFVTFGLQLLLFASPVAYPPELVPERWQELLYVNPLAGSLALLRWALVQGDLPPVSNLLLSGAVAVVCVFVGLLHFRRSEREFADII